MIALLLLACTPLPADTGVVEYGASPTDSGPGGPLRWQAVAVGYQQACAVTTDGDLRCWGNPTPDTYGRTMDVLSAYAPRGKFTAVSMSAEWSDHFSEPACALAADGSVRCWGEYSAAIPGPMLNFEAGYSFSCGVQRDDGSVYCYAPEEDDRLDRLAALPPLVSLRILGNEVAGVTRDGELVTRTIRPARVALRVRPPDGPWRAVVPTPWWGYCGLRTTGELRCWPRSVAVDPTWVQSPPSGTYTDFCYGGFGCAIGTDGRVVCWGDERVEAPSGTFTAIACGYASACGVTTGGELSCWGDCAFGVCDGPE